MPTGIGFGPGSKRKRLAKIRGREISPWPAVSVVQAGSYPCPACPGGFGVAGQACHLLESYNEDRKLLLDADNVGELIVPKGGGKSRPSNFSGRVDSPWWAPGVKVRRGFYELYSSMYYEIDRRVAAVLNQHPDTQVIVTGHSLGAAMAVVCAHHLQCVLGAAINGGGPFCFPFCTPRVGDFRFARHFKNAIGSKTAPMCGNGSYSRCISFCMDNDPVSNKGDKGYERDHGDKDRKDAKGRLIISQGSRKANSSFLGKVFYGLTKKTDSSIQFYKTPNVYQFGWYALWNVHSYKQCQKKFLGRVLFTH